MHLAYDTLSLPRPSLLSCQGEAETTLSKRYLCAKFNALDTTCQSIAVFPHGDMHVLPIRSRRPRSKRSFCSTSSIEHTCCFHRFRLEDDMYCTRLRLKRQKNVMMFYISLLGWHVACSSASQRLHRTTFISSPRSLRFRQILHFAARALGPA